jgi:regulator of protease activity HflC (stomatin/prohibitin superfamily)
MTQEQEAWRLIRRLCLFYATAALGLAAVLAIPARTPLFAEIRRSGIASLPLGALLIVLGGLAGAAFLARARAGGDARAIGRAARLPQVVLVPAFALAGAALAWAMHPMAGGIVDAATRCYALGAAAIGLSFPLLVAERVLAAQPAARVPEAAGLRGLAAVAAGASFAAGLCELAAGFGLPFTPRVAALVAALVAATGVELAARAAARVFLPPPEAGSARAACRSMLADLLSAGARGEAGVAAPMRAHLGIDFSRSWALAYVRAAAWPMAFGMGLLAWGLSGVVVLPLEQRAIYERFGQPVRVLHPGLHVILPWPLGSARRVDFGAVHDLALAGAGASTAPAAPAEDPAPPQADRLWDTPHPGEVTLTIASATGKRQTFQSVSADIRLLYRVGLTDAQALASAYGTTDPGLLVQAVAGRAVARYYADRTLEAVLGAQREAMAGDVRRAVQADLDRMGSGLEMVAVVIEAIHPPAGAADAYHNVRVAEINARAKIASDRGVALVIRSQSTQFISDRVNAARGQAAELVGAARAEATRFAADEIAAKAGGQAFLVERYFTDLEKALPRSSITIIDHRLSAPDAPVLDLRPLAGARRTTGDGE